MKTSVYNYCFRLTNGSLLLFNFYTLTLAVFKPNEADLVERFLNTPSEYFSEGQDRELYQLLCQQGFLITDGLDERRALQAMNTHGKREQSCLSLTIAPTLNCNFHCVYCYETRGRPKLDTDVEEAIQRLVEVRSSNGQAVHVTWFGGEPLLCMDIIQRLSGKLINACERHGVKYGAHVITNGYLLDGLTATRLSELHVSDAQVTLDGPPEIHDSRRPLRGGGNTFKQVFTNLADSCNKLTINVRMNVDQTNRQHVPHLLAILQNANLEKRVGFYLGQTLPYTEHCRDMAGSCLSNKDFTLLDLEIGLEMLRRGFSSTRMPRSRDVYCMADQVNSFAISPSGGIFKCWNEICMEECEVGHMLKPTTSTMQDNMKRWELRNPFNGECADCLLLPICMGGCPYLYHQTNQVQCHEWKYHLNESLLFYYYLKKLHQQSEFATGFWKLVDEIETHLKER